MFPPLTLVVKILLQIILIIPKSIQDGHYSHSVVIGFDDTLSHHFTCDTLTF